MSRQYLGLFQQRFRSIIITPFRPCISSRRDRSAARLSLLISFHMAGAALSVSPFASRAQEVSEQ